MEGTFPVHSATTVLLSSTTTISYCVGHCPRASPLRYCYCPQQQCHHKLLSISPLPAMQGLRDSVRMIQSSSEPKLSALSPLAAALSMQEVMESPAPAQQKLPPTQALEAPSGQPPTESNLIHLGETLSPSHISL